MASAVGQTISDVISVRDDDHLAILDLTDGDFTTLEAFSILTPATTAAATLTELDGGLYRISFVPTMTGEWAFHSLYEDDPIFREELRRYEVVTGAQANPVQYLAGSSITLISPMVASGDIAIYQGDDYDSDEGRALVWSITGASDLTGATVTLLINQGAAEFSFEASVTDAGEAIQIVTVELSSEETGALSLLVGSYKIGAELQNGHKETLVRGRVFVTGDLTGVEA